MPEQNIALEAESKLQLQEDKNTANRAFTEYAIEERQDIAL